MTHDQHKIDDCIEHGDRTASQEREEEIHASYAAQIEALESRNDDLDERIELLQAELRTLRAEAAESQAGMTGGSD